MSLFLGHSGEGSPGVAWSTAPASAARAGREWTWVTRFTLLLHKQSSSFLIQEGLIFTGGSVDALLQFTLVFLHSRVLASSLLLPAPVLCHICLRYVGSPYYGEKINMSPGIFSLKSKM